MFQESEGDDEGEEEVEDEGEDEQQENEASLAATADPGKPGLSPLSVPPREPERQLSKKELKKKELAELDAVLLELGLTPKEENGCLSSPSSLVYRFRVLLGLVHNYVRE